MKILSFLGLIVAASAAQADITVADIQNASDALNAGRWTDAAKLYEKLATESPKNADYWGAYGQALFQAGRYDEAYQAAQRAADLGYFPWICLYSQARCRGAQGDKEATLKALEKALKAGWYGANPPGTEKEFDLLRTDKRFIEVTGLGFDKKSVSRDEGWRKDVKFLISEARREHYDFDKVHGKKAVDDAVAKLLKDIPHLQNHEIVYRMIGLMAMAGDGHTWLQPPPAGDYAFHTLPIQVFGFKEGYYVTGATADYKDVLGLKLVAIEKTPLEEAIKRLAPAISGEISQTILARTPTRLMIPEALNAEHLAAKVDETTLTFEKPDGTKLTKTFKPVPLLPAPNFVTVYDPANAPLYLRARQNEYWFEFLADSKTIYVQYNAVRSKGDEPIDKFWDRVFKFIQDNPVEHMVLDIRWNGGGNLFLNDSLLYGIVKCDKINQLGKLFVITGRGTYSAAASLTGKLDRMTNALFVGEPAGSSPNFVGEGSNITLPYSGLRASASHLYWQNTHAMDNRIWIGPNIPAEPSWELYRQGRDPAMEAILKAIG